MNESDVNGSMVLGERGRDQLMFDIYWLVACD